MTPAAIWNDLPPALRTQGAGTVLVQALWHSTWFLAGVWCSNRFLSRLAPSLRCAIWWGVGVQMLVVWLLAAPALLPAGFSPGVGPAAPTLLTLWGVGLVFRSVLLRRQYRGFRHLVVESVPAPACEATAMVAELATRLALRRPPNVLVSHRLKTPVLAGLWRPVLLIPASALERPVTAALRMAAAHELAHLRRRDLWLGLAPVLMQTAMFFHPLAWLVVREYALAREEACDAEARHITQTQPGDYGAMLLEYVAAARQPAQQRCSARFHYLTLQRRLNAMQIPYERPRQGQLGALCSLCILGGICMSVVQMIEPGSTPDQRVSDSQAATGSFRVASIQQALPVPAPSLPIKARAVSHAPAASPHRFRMAAVSHKANAKVHLPVASLPRTVTAIPAAAAPPAHARPATAVAVIARQMPHAAPKPQIAIVVCDTPPELDAAVASPDLSRMRTDLQALRRQLSAQRGQFKQEGLPVLLVPDKEFGKQWREQMQSQFGPQFQEQWKRKSAEMRAQIDAQLNAQMPAFRAQAEQARRDALRAQAEALPSQTLAEQARKQALAESARAREQALQESKQAREQTLQELQKELLRIQEELKEELHGPLPPVPPLASGADDVPF